MAAKASLLVTRTSFEARSRTSRSRRCDRFGYDVAMKTMRCIPIRGLAAAVVALALALTLAVAPATAALAQDVVGQDGVPATVLAAEERERRPIAPTQRDQLGLLLYALMGLTVVVGFATMRRQLKGDRPQTDGEFRWR